MRWLTVAQFAEQESLHPQTVYGAVRDGRLRHKKHGRAIRIPSDAVIEPIEKSTPKSTPDRRRNTIRNNGRSTSDGCQSSKPEKKRWYWEEPGYRSPAGARR